MKLTRRLLPPNLFLALLLGLSSTAGFGAERAPTPPRALQAEPHGRVIVKFKEDATWRKRILAVQEGDRRTAEPVAVQHLLQMRADILGAGVGVPLRAVSALDERSQVVVAEGVDAKKLAAMIARDASVEYVVPDARRRAARVPNDPLYVPSVAPANGPASGQWYLKPPTASTLTTGNEVLSSIDAQGAWDITTGHPSVVVAVLDTGVRADHPDLAGKLLPGYDLVSDATVANDGNGDDADPSDPGDWVDQADLNNSLFKECEVTDSSWHGTQVSGMIAAATNNGAGMAGAGWNVRVLPVRVLGKCFGYDSDILRGMRWAAGISVPGLPANPHPAKVLNLSLGGEGGCSQAYVDTVAQVSAAPRNAVVVAAAGNTSGRAVNNPANCPGVIGVTALRHIGTKVGFSDLGPEITIAAPGGNCVNTGANDACLFPLLTTSNTGRTAPGTPTYTNSFDVSVGTSFSAPLVSGTVALMLTANPSLTPVQVRSALRSTARPFPSAGAPADPDLGVIQVCRAPGAFDQFQCYCTTSTCGAGMLDARGAVASVAQLVAYVTVPATVTAGQPVTIGSEASVVQPGATLVSREWSLLTPGAGITAISDPLAPTLTLTPLTDGTLVVQLKVTDSAGRTATAQQTIVVGQAAAPPQDNGNTGGDSGGGGALSAFWLAALALAALLSRPGSPRRRP